MSLEQIGLGGVLTFDETKGVRGMQNAQRSATLLERSFKTLSGVVGGFGKAFNAVGQSARYLGLAGLPITGAMVMASKEAADFEQQMSAVKAITGANSTEMEKLSTKAKQLGASTVFTAKQAGEAEERLSRAGFSVQEQLSSVGPVMNMAAADSMSLADSSRITANAIRAMNLPISEAGRVTDVLATASAKSFTDIMQLGDAMKYALPQAHNMDIEFEDVIATLGAVSDAGLHASIGGTSFTQAMIKLLKPTEAGQKLLDKYNITIGKTASGHTDLIGVFEQLSTSIESMPNALDRARAITELFGVRGQKAISAVMTSISAGRMRMLADELHKSAGAAERMAKVRLDNLSGAITLLKSAISGFAIETGGMFTGMLKTNVQSYAKAIGNVAQALTALNSEQGLSSEDAQKFGDTAVSVARGIKAGIEDVKKSIENLKGEVVKLFEELTGKKSNESIEKFSQIATKVTLITGLIAPLLAGFGAFSLFIKMAIFPMFNMIGILANGLIGVVGAISAPVLLVIGTITIALIAAFQAYRQEGESVGNTFQRLWGNIKSGWDWIDQNVIQPFVNAFNNSIPSAIGWLSEIWSEFGETMKKDFSDIWETIKIVAEWAAPYLGSVAKAIVTGFELAAGSILVIIGTIVHGVKELIIGTVNTIVNSIKWIAEKIGAFASFLGNEDFAKKMKEFGKGHYNVEDYFQKPERGMGPKEINMTPIEQRSKAEREKAIRQKMGLTYSIGGQEAKNQYRTTMAWQKIKIEDESRKRDQEFYKKMQDDMGKSIKESMPKDLTVNSTVCVDGKQVGKAVAKHKREVSERAGFKATPWQRRCAAEHGANTMTGV